MTPFFHFWNNTVAVQFGIFHRFTQALLCPACLSVPITGKKLGTCPSLAKVKAIETFKLQWQKTLKLSKIVIMLLEYDFIIKNVFWFQALTVT